METDDLTPVMQEMLAEMATMRAELNDLKERAQALPHPSRPASIPTSITSTRRKTLKRLGLALLGGAAAATALGQSPVQAKVVANPQTNGLVNRAGMLVLPPGATPPGGTAPAHTYGLIASGDITPIDLSTLPGGNTGVYGNSSGYGVFGNGITGVVGIGTSTGVYGQGTTYGVSGVGSIAGVYAGGNGYGSTGVYATTGGGSSTGVYASGSLYGVNASGTGSGSYGVTASGSLYGVYGSSTGSGTQYGVYGKGYYGTYGEGTTCGAFGSGGQYGVFGSGTQYGVYGDGPIGVGAASSTGGANFPALRADNYASNGIAAIFANNSNDTTLLITNTGTGPLIKGWAANAVPKFQVDNNGTVHTAASYTVGGIDLAEVIPVTEKLEPGDVVEIDPETTGQFRKCTIVGSLAVAGVISTRPGVSLGVKDPAEADHNSKPQLALAGRIPVKVTAEGGPINPGDLLIASFTPGHAMRAPCPAQQGSVLGKALGRLDSESGACIIEMLVMLR